MCLYDYQDYRLFLKDTLEKRMSRNRSYSLRAFAKDLQVSPQVLSGVLRNKKGISTGTASKLASRLSMNDDETLYFCDLVEVLHARNPAGRQIASLRLKRVTVSSEFKVLSEDVFQAISEWYHYALLELTYVKGFQSDAKWIAKKLNISIHQAAQAVSRLKRLQLLKEINGKLEKTDRNIGTSHDIPSEGIRKYTQQILERAMEALELQDLKTRDFTTMTMAIDPRRMEKAKDLIRSFRRKLCAYLEQGERTEVYSVAIQLFRLTQADPKKEGT